MRLKMFFLPVFALLFLLAACGGPKADVSIFILPHQGMPVEMADKLQKNLQTELGQNTTVAVSTSPISTPDKLMVEVAAGDHGIVILPKDQWLALAQNGSMVSLDDLLSPADYPDGVVELPVSETKKEKHLYAVPVTKSKWLTDVGYKDEDLYAFIHPRAPHMEKAKQVLKAIVGK